LIDGALPSLRLYDVVAMHTAEARVIRVTSVNLVSIIIVPLLITAERAAEWSV
jgi:hypothetical protein